MGTTRAVMVRFRGRRGVPVPGVAVSLLLGAMLLGGCPASDSPEGGEIEVIEVEPAPTTLLTTLYDEQATQRHDAFSGVLPSDFPADLPLYDPSNLTDFGSDGGARYVLMFTPDAATMVRDRMQVELARSGWAQIEGDDVRGTYRRGSHAVILDIRDANPGTEIRVEY